MLRSLRAVAGGAAKYAATRGLGLTGGVLEKAGKTVYGASLLPIALVGYPLMRMAGAGLGLAARAATGVAGGIINHGPGAVRSIGQHLNKNYAPLSKRPWLVGTAAAGMLAAAGIKAVGDRAQERMHAHNAASHMGLGQSLHQAHR